VNARNDERDIEDDGFFTIDMHEPQECDECEGAGCPECHGEGVVESKLDGLEYRCSECTKEHEVQQYP
jgi:hypothetical protein